MNQNLNDIKDLLIQVKGGVTKVSADVTRLHEKIDSITDAPTPEEWQEVKDIANSIKENISAIDELTPEEETSTGSGDSGITTTTNGDGSGQPGGEGTGSGSGSDTTDTTGADSTGTASEGQE